MKEKIKVELSAETHRNRRDCTCYSCMKKETRNYLNTNQNESNKRTSRRSSFGLEPSEK